VAMMNQPLLSLLLPLADCLLEGIEGEVAPERTRYAPPHDPAAEGIDDKGHVDEALPGGHIRQIRDPELVRTLGAEVPLHQVEWALCRLGRDRRPRLASATDRALKPELSHQALHRTARHLSALALQLAPDFTRTVDLQVVLPDPADLLPKHLVSLGPSGAKRRIALLCLVGVVGRRSDRQQAADRLDSVLLPVSVDEGHHHLSPRPCSAWAKKAAAFRKISLARRSSRTSRSSSLIRSRSAVVGPGCLPRSRSACRTQLRSVSPEQPIFAAIDWMAAHCDTFSPSCSNTSRTARSRTSGEYFFACLMTPISQRLESPANPAVQSGLLSPLAE